MILLIETIYGYPTYRTLCMNIIDWNMFQEYKLTAGPCIECYEPGMIQFILPLDHHEEFYVPGIEPSYS